jgi:hypothetical protein
VGNFETCGKLGDSVSDANQSVNQEDDRKQRESKLRLPVACGTNSGYQKHIRDGTSRVFRARWRTLRTRESTAEARHIRRQFLSHVRWKAVTA